MEKEMRRKKQALNSMKCNQILSEATSGVLSLASKDGMPYGVPLSYACDPGRNAIYFHCAKEGKKIDLIQENPKASFCVIGQDEIVPEHFTTNYKSVMASGEVRQVIDQDEINHALMLLAKKYSPTVSEAQVTKEIESGLPRVGILRLDIHSLSGKQSKELMLAENLKKEKTAKKDNLSPKTLETVIFDMDGLMIDSERVTYENYKKILEKQGLEFDLPFYTRFLGKTKEAILNTLNERYGNIEGFDAHEVYLQMHQLNNRTYETEGVPVKPGLVSLLKMLKKKGIKTVIATSSNRHRVEDILKKADLEDLFDDAVCGDEISNSKPDPEIFIKAMEKAGSAPSHCLVLEDSQAGIAAAHAASIPVICVIDLKVPEEEFEKMTWKTLHSLEEVQALLEA